MTLGAASGRADFDVELAAAGNTEVVRSKVAVMKSLGIPGPLEDILVTLDDQYHLLRPLGRNEQMFLYVAISRDKGNLGLARHKLAEVEKQLVL